MTVSTATRHHYWFMCNAKSVRNIVVVLDYWFCYWHFVRGRCIQNRRWTRSSFCCLMSWYVCWFDLVWASSLIICKVEMISKKKLSANCSQAHFWMVLFSDSSEMTSSTSSPMYRNSSNWSEYASFKVTTLLPNLKEVVVEGWSSSHGSWSQWWDEGVSPWPLQDDSVVWTAPPPSEGFIQATFSPIWVSNEKAPPLLTG